MFDADEEPEMRRRLKCSQELKITGQVSYCGQPASIHAAMEAI